MDDYKRLALDISNRFPFKEFQVAAHAANGKDEEASLSACANHLDRDFMQLLDEGKHLDALVM